MSAQLVDAEALPWLTGHEVFASMAPAFRDNLDPHGDPHRVEELLGRYHVRVLWLDPDSGRRIDQVRVDPGYVDLCEAFHDSVEEAYFVTGTARLSAEGDFGPGDYFWRPPGWVHAARSETGYDAIVTLEGTCPSEGSGPVTRVPCDDRDAGRHVASAHDPVGPRGYVRRLSSRAHGWSTPEPTVAAAMGDDISVRLLSVNAVTGAATALLRLPEGWSAPVAPTARETFVVVVGGTLLVDGREVSAGSLVRTGVGDRPLRMSCAGPVEVLLKVGQAAR